MRKQKAIDTFRRQYRTADMYLSLKILAGKRMRLSLGDIARALEIPVRDIELEMDILRQDAR